VDVQRLSGEGAGSTYRQGVKGPFGRRVAADYEVTGFEPNKGLSFRAVAGPVRPEGHYEFEATDGATRVKMALDYEPKGLAKLMSPMVEKTMQSEVQALANLKAVLESEH
jgi:uncharacterized membrane protein